MPIKAFLTAFMAGEATRQFLFPSITTWRVHIALIVLAGLASAIAAYIPLKSGTRRPAHHGDLWQTRCAANLTAFALASSFGRRRNLNTRATGWLAGGFNVLALLVAPVASCMASGAL